MNPETPPQPLSTAATTPLPEIVVPTVAAVVMTTPSVKNKKLLIGLAAAGGATVIAVITGITILITLGASHHYRNLHTASVGSKASEKAVFSYPSKMAQVNNSSDTAVFADYAAEASSKVIYSEVDVDSAPVGSLSTETISSFRDIMINKKAGYQQTIDGFSSQTNNEAFNIVFGKFSDFTNSHNIKGLQANFTYTAKTGGKPGKGRLIFAFGKQRLYGMIMLAQQNVWNDNSVIWAKVADSLAVDQR